MCACVRVDVGVGVSWHLTRHSRWYDSQLPRVPQCSKQSILHKELLFTKHENARDLLIVLLHTEIYINIIS